MLDFTQINSLTLGGKGVHWLYLNGKAILPRTNGYTLANDSAYAALQNATVAQTLSHGGKSYNVYGTFDNKLWTGAGAGNVRPWFISPHVMISAHHYTSKPTGSLKISDSLTVNRLQWVNLKDWALQHGFTEDDFPNPQMDYDVDMITLDKSTGLDQSECPWLMNQETKDSLFPHGEVTGIVGWNSSQATNKAIPILFNKERYSFMEWDRAYNSSNWNILQSRFQTLPSITSEQYPIVEGDSGKPKYIRIGNKDIVISQSYSSGSGSNLTGIFAPIKAFVEAYGDTLNVFTEI